MKTQKIKKLSLFLMLTLSLISFNAQAQERRDGGEIGDDDEREENDDGDFERGRGHGNGNERSERPRGVRLGRTRHMGDGCAAGTVTAVLSPDSTTLTLLFDDYIVQAGNSAGVRRAGKSCSVGVPFEVPEGYRVSVTKMDYRGFNALPAGSRSVLQTGYTFFDNQRKRRSKHKFARRMVFQGPLNEDYTISSTIRRRPLYSRCGSSFNMELTTSVITTTNAQGEDALTSLDSVDMQSENVQYFLNWEKCDPRRGSPQGRKPWNP